MRLTLTFKFQPSPGEDVVDPQVYRNIRDLMERGAKENGFGLQHYGVHQIELRWLLDSAPIALPTVVETVAMQEG